MVLSVSYRLALAAQAGRPVRLFIVCVRSCLTCSLAEITALSGPNGNIDFLNCGLTSGGWTPPLLHITDIVTVKLSQVAYNPGSAFSPCQDFVPIFEKYGQQYGSQSQFSPCLRIWTNHWALELVPAVMLAAFAMQESSCIPTTVGGAGEQGLMQITADKCGGAPGGNCQDPVRVSMLVVLRFLTGNFFRTLTSSKGLNSSHKL